MSSGIIAMFYLNLFNSYTNFIVIILLAIQFIIVSSGLK